MKLQTCVGAFTVGFLGLLAGCGSSNDASDSNFRAALADIRPDKSCLIINRRNVSDIERTNVHGGVFEGYPIFQAFVQSGYLERLKHPGNDAIYVLTAKSEPIARRIDSKMGMGYRIGLCAGKVEIDNLTYTIPAEGTSSTSSVRVKWRVDGVPQEFAAMNENAGADSFTVSKAETSGESNYRLQLTNEGWKIMDTPF